jgi:hypothetical protein
MERSDIPPFPSIPWAEKVGNSSNIAARRATLQEKDTEREANLGEDLRRQVVEFVDKGEARIDKERSRWREALDRDAQLRIPHAKFRLLLKAEKEKKKLEKKWQEDKEKAEASGTQPDTSPATTTRGTTESGEHTHTDRGDQHPGWIRPGLATRGLRVRYGHQLWEHHAHLWDKANSFWEKVKIGIAKAEAVQRSSCMASPHATRSMLEVGGDKDCGVGTSDRRHKRAASKTHT